MSNSALGEPAEHHTPVFCRRLEVAGERYSINRAWECSSVRKLARFLDNAPLEGQADTCVIVGNGPSLNKIDLTCLEQADVFISNLAIEHTELLRQAKYVAVVNHLVAKEAAPALGRIASNRSNLAPSLNAIFLPTHLRTLLPDNAITQFVKLAPTPAFQQHYASGASGQSTVSYFMLQLAFWLGYQRVLLIGIDNQYQQPSNVREGTVLFQQGPDLNHFSRNYFAGKQWQAADTDKMAAVYELSQRAYESAGRSIVNCSVGGALEVFPRGDLSEELAKPSVKTENGFTPPALGSLQSLFQRYHRLSDSFARGVLLSYPFVLVCALLYYWLDASAFSNGLLVTTLLTLALITPACLLIVFLKYMQRQGDQTEFELLTLRASVHRLQSE